MIPAVLIAFFVAQAILVEPPHRHRLHRTPGVARAVIGAALYLTVVGLFGLGLGAIVRNTAGGIATFAGDHVRAAAADERAPGELEHAASPYLPLEAGEALLALTRGDHLAPWVGFGVLCGYAPRALAIAAVLLVRSDV